MKIAAAQRQLDELTRMFSHSDLTLGWSVKYQAAADWRSKRQIPHAECSGVYIYASPEGEIWYIGKGEYEAGGGIGKRCCAHLGTPDFEGDVFFPYHQWANVDKQSGGFDPIKCAIARGEFDIWTIRVEPAFFTSLVEVFMQTCCRASDGHLPPLNERIG